MGNLLVSQPTGRQFNDLALPSGDMHLRLTKDFIWNRASTPISLNAAGKAVLAF
jgi:hypothetical protein